MWNLFGDLVSMSHPVVRVSTGAKVRDLVSTAEATLQVQTSLKELKKPTKETHSEGSIRSQKDK